MDSIRNSSAGSEDKWGVQMMKLCGRDRNVGRNLAEQRELTSRHR